MHTTMNRRALVAGAAVLPAIAIPAAAQCIPKELDAELLVLGAQLNRAHEEAERLSEAFEAINQPLHDHAMETASIMFPHQTHPKEWGALFFELWKKGADAAQPAYRDADKAMDAAWARYGAIAKVISETPAKTFQGLAVKVQLCKESYPQLFGGPTEDADHRCLRMLTDEIAVAA
jgi:hypothetical protein